MFTRDKEFEEALASPEALESHIEKLTKYRRLALGMYTFLLVAFFVMVFMGLSTKNPPGGMLIMPPLMLLGSLSQLSFALSAQADIRGLKAHKKALELLNSAEK